MTEHHEHEQEHRARARRPRGPRGARPRRPRSHGHEHDHAGHEHVAYPTPWPIPGRQGRVLPQARDSPIPAASARLPGTPLLPRRRGPPFRRAGARAVCRQRAGALPDPDLGRQARDAERAGPSLSSRGATHTLTGYSSQGADSGSLFVPFLDTTSGNETPTAPAATWTCTWSRMVVRPRLQPRLPPVCVYDPKYSSPLTPAENRLPVRIEAGERLPPDH